jgi:hypothetical protein
MVGQLLPHLGQQLAHHAVPLEPLQAAGTPASDASPA